MNSGSAADWPKYSTLFDCTTGICSLSCPQWCTNNNIIPSSPPPSSYFQKYYHQRPLSPLVISLIAILTTAILLLTYFSFFLTRYCTRPGPTSHNHNIHHETSTTTTAASIPVVCTYTRSSNGCSKVHEATECAVCLGEFEEGESLRLLPICNHAFHLACIDAWLKSNSTCPLCRSSIIPPPLPLPLPCISPLRVSGPDDAVITVRDGIHDVVVVFEAVGGGGDKAESVVVGFSEAWTGRGGSASMEG